MMEILRTPDQQFEGLEDYPFEPNYTIVKTEDGSDLRIHYLDEGPREGPKVLCMHGQPTWSYLYRHMIPLLTGAGLRVIAPDLPGFGKSDKPAARTDYSYNGQVRWMNDWLSANDFSGLTFFGQDWGGLIGLRMVTSQPDRFDRVVISNTGLPRGANLTDEQIEQFNNYKSDAPTPTLIDMATEIRKIDPDNYHMKFGVWQKFCWETEDLPVGLIMATSTGGDSDQISEKVKAYDAPFPDPAFKMGPRAMPSQVPVLPTDPTLTAQAEAWEVLGSFDKPFLCAFGDNDPITRGGENFFSKAVPGAQGLPHTTIQGAGHFIQEEAPEELSKIIIDFVHSTSS